MSLKLTLKDNVVRIIHPENLVTTVLARLFHEAEIEVVDGKVTESAVGIMLNSRNQEFAGALEVVFSKYFEAVNEARKPHQPPAETLPVQKKPIDYTKVSFLAADGKKVKTVNVVDLVSRLNEAMSKSTENILSKFLGKIGLCKTDAFEVITLANDLMRFDDFEQIHELLYDYIKLESDYNLSELESELESAMEDRKIESDRKLSEIKEKLNSEVMSETE